MWDHVMPGEHFADGLCWSQLANANQEEQR